MALGDGRLHYTLHLTNNCNLSCNYCYVNKKDISTMSIGVAKKVVEAGASENGSTNIAFFGGEPLLCKDTIYQAVEYARWKERQSNCRFHFKVVTNGLLLDEEFIEFSRREHIFIVLSHDGIKEAHDKNRVDINGKGTFDCLSEKISLLLSSHPYAPVMMVVNPDTASYFSESIKYLYKRGFKYIISSLNFTGCWTEDTLDALKREYQKIAEFYYEKTLLEDKFYLEPFETKISSHIKGENYCIENCTFGKKQVSVSPDGFIYPCVQFIGEDAFVIGHIASGIDEVKQNALFRANQEEKESCIECKIRTRCNHYCGCLNKQTTGHIDRISPVLCAHERMLLSIADRLAHKLFKKRNAMFIQKHYNDIYPFLSMIEDSILSKGKS